ncbi:uncharacterized protein LOC131932087 [Physella acuta]|uniref:uncharacterized protein LOC131932087 n=1 Tax=Physella acuta TaxID=109671 RepID=UPI0027DDEF5B|nr:uncharacterized protein LOC131932087 [Physella acuta]
MRDLNIEQCYNCACDYVQFFDGPSNSSRSLGRQCTFVYGSVVQSSTNVMSVLFYSNKNFTYRGFKATYIINDLPFGSTCSNALQCEIGLDCEDETCSCPRHQYYDMAANQCWDKRIKGSLCNADEECFNTMVCIQWSCECTADKFYSNVTLTCHNKLAQGEMCNNSVPGMCQSPNLDCVPDDVGVYRCLSENQTRIPECPRDPGELESLHIEEKGTTFILLKWKLLNLDQNVTIRVNWSSGGMTSVDGEQLAGPTGTNITELTPGQVYNFTILALLGDGTQKADVLVLHSFVDAMLPGTPGGDSFSISHVPTPYTSHILTPPPNTVLTPPYTLTFPPSPGVVDHYHITLTSASTTSYHQTTTTRLDLTGLRPDTAHGYSVVAYNRRGEYSRPLTGVFVTAPETTALPLDISDDHMDWKNVFIVGIVTSVIFCLAISTCWLTSWALGRRRTRDQQKMESIQSDEKTFCNELSTRYLEVKDNEYDKPSRTDYGEENLYSTTAGTPQCTGRRTKSLARNKLGEVNHTMTYNNKEELYNTGERNEYVPPDTTCKQEENKEDRDDYLEPVVKRNLILQNNSIDKVSPKFKNDNSKIQENKGQVNEYILPDLDTYFTITDSMEKKTDDLMDEKIQEQNMNSDVVKTVSLVSEIYYNKESS